MTTFHAPYNHRTLTIGQHADGSGITFHAEDGSASVGVYLDPADAPAIALAVLEAAGHEEVLNPNGALESAVESLAVHIRVTEAKAAAAAEEAARGKRRDELAREFANVIYDGLGYIRKLLIDRIIDTEQELAKERAK